MTQATHEGDSSRSKENLAATPNEQRRQSYISGRTTPHATTHSRSASGTDSRTVPWQPAVASTQQQPDRQKLDPEEWVKHRASQQPIPLAYGSYGHGRNNSHTPPPLGGRQRSGDWSHMRRSPEGSPGPVRPSSRHLSRPNSRGAEELLDTRPTILSAKELQQVARMTGTSLLSAVPNQTNQEPPRGLTGFIDYRQREKAAAKANRLAYSAAMQAEIDRRSLTNQQKQVAEVQARQRQMLEMQQLQIQQQQQQMQASLAQSHHGYAQSVMGMSAGAPSVMGMPTGPGTPQGMVGMAYSSPHQMSAQMYQNPGYFQQPAMTPNTNHMPGGWGTPTPQTPQGQYFQQQQQMQFGQQQAPATQPYGASFDQAQAARQGQQQQHYRR